MKANSEIRKQAYSSLSGKWGISALCVLIVYVISGAAAYIPFVGGIATLLLLPLNYGLVILFLKNLRGEPIEVGRLFDGFKDYIRIFCTLLLQAIYVFLWTLLLIIPGIIKGYSYAMTVYILKDDPALQNNAAIEKSMRMMQGHKMDLFLLDLSFIGWVILSCLTLGIGFLFLIPYIQSSHAAFYEDLKNEMSIAKE